MFKTTPHLHPEEEREKVEHATCNSSLHYSNPQFQTIVTGQPANGFSLQWRVDLR
jgi:hypothetical protein